MFRVLFRKTQGAAVVGLVSAAGVYMIERIQENKRHRVTLDVARIDDELCRLREELKFLKQLQNERHNNTIHTKPAKRRIKAPSIISSISNDEYNSAIDADSSEEYYDLSSDEDVTIVSEHSVNLLDTEIQAVDACLEQENYNSALQKLELLNKEHPQNPEIMWRLGKALKIKITFTADATTRKELLTEGISFCENAVDIKPDSAHCHKWLAILYGLRGDLQPTKERILDGHLYSKHIKKALNITPDDAELHHLLGRFTFEVAKLSWLEKTIAGSLFAELPSCTYEDALKQFLEAENRISYEWKENRLFIAKCELAIGKTEKAVEWLNKAENARNDEDEKVHEEVKMLLEKYRK